MAATSSMGVSEDGAAAKVDFLHFGVVPDIAEGSVEDIRNDPKVQEVYLGGGTVFGEADHA